MARKIKQKIAKSGFTLIEILMVISIIGFLASLMLVSFNNARLRARDAKRVAETRNILVALINFYNDKGRFPCHEFSSSSSPSGPDLNFLTPLWQQGYLAGRPDDPFAGSASYAFYAYGTFKQVAAGPCGQIAFFEFTTESPATCPGMTTTFPFLYDHGGSHCHIFYPEFLPPPCDTPDYYQYPTDCAQLIDTGADDEYP